MSEIEMPSEGIQQTRWSRNECALCAEPLPADAGFSTRYCGPKCRAAMTKLIRQHRNRQGASR